MVWALAIHVLRTALPDRRSRLLTGLTLSRAGLPLRSQQRPDNPRGVLRRKARYGIKPERAHARQIRSCSGHLQLQFGLERHRKGGTELTYILAVASGE